MVRGTLSDQQPGVVGGHGRPDPCLLRLPQPRSRHAQPCCEVLCASDALSEGLTSFQVLENTRVSLLCPAGIVIDGLARDIKGLSTEIRIGTTLILDSGVLRDQ